MRHTRTVFLAVSALLLVFLLNPGQVQAFEKTGTTAAAFLQIPVGSRLPAMGGAGVALEGGADMLPMNPAAARAGRGFGISASYIDWFAGLRHQSVGLIIPVSTTLAVGLNAISFSGDDFEQTTLAAQEGNGIMVNYGDLAVGISGVSTLTDRFTVGVSGKLIRQQLFHETASTFAFDVGTHLKTDLEGFTIGMAMTQLGGEMQLEGRDLLQEPGGVSGGSTRYETSAWPLPLTFQTGIGWKLLGEGNAYAHNGFHSFDIAVDARHVNEGFTTLHFGAETGFANSLFFRAGHTVGHDSQGMSFGLGVVVNVYQHRLTADFAYADLGDLESVQRVTLSLTHR
ncbi:PorV/PorQ family protein [bacterium]|nr:PorV/PorQ family protein [bacterium]